MEQDLWRFIFAQPEGGGVEVPVLECRANGCEIQVLGVMNDAKMRSGGEVAGWQAIVGRLKASDLSRSLKLAGTMMATIGDRTVYITTLERQREGEGAAAPSE